MNLFYSLPNDLFLMIYHFVDIKSKNEMKTLNKYFKRICAFNAKTLRIHEADDVFIKNYPRDILVKILQSHTKIQKLILGSINNAWVDGAEFTLNETRYVDELIAHLSKHKNELSHIDKIIIQEIQYISPPPLYSEQYSEQYRIYNEHNIAWFKVFGHANLRSLTILARQNSSRHIQQLLNKAIRLKKFTLKSHHSLVHYEISLKGLTELTSVKFINFSVPISTFTSLNTCYNLHTLVIDTHSEFNHDILNVLIDIDQGIWPLKRLEIANISINLNTELHILAEKYPQLERLSVFINMDVGMDINDIVINRIFWPNLQFFHFNGRDITSNALDILTKHMSKLQTLLFNYNQHYRLTGFITITSDCINSITKNCPNLQILKLPIMNELKKSDIITLTQNCNALKILNINFITFTANTLDDLRYLINHLPKLTHCKFDSFLNDFSRHKNTFMIEFPRVQWFIPYPLKPELFIDSINN